MADENNGIGDRLKDAWTPRMIRSMVLSSFCNRSYLICGILGGGFNLAVWQITYVHVNIAKLNVCHLACKHGFLSIQYSKPPIKNLANCIFRANHQILTCQ